MPSSGFAIEGVFLGGTDVSASGVTVSPGGAVRGVRVELTRRTAAIGGVVRDARGAATPSAIVMVFAEDRAKWSDALARFVRVTRPAGNGRYAVAGLLPGHYRVAVVPSIRAGTIGDPAVLSKLMPAALRIQLDAEQSKDLDLAVR